MVDKSYFFFGDPYGNRTHVTAVKGRCLNRLTNGPGSGNLIRTDDIPGMNRLLYQLSYAAILVNDLGTAEISFISITQEAENVKCFFEIFSIFFGACKWAFLELSKNEVIASHPTSGFTLLAMICGVRDCTIICDLAPFTAAKGLYATLQLIFI